MQMFEGELTESEKRSMRDLCEELGAKLVLIHTQTNVLTSEQALDILKSN
jgi:hypothetical protein